MKRRQFTQVFALLAGGLTLPVSASISTALNTLLAEPADQGLSRDYFEKQVGEVFSLRNSESRTLLLKAVEDACGPDCCEQFHAVFEASPGIQLKEGIYQLNSDHAGTLDLFLTESVHGDRKNQHFVAIINLQQTA